jgi:hypothetical protein
MFGHMIESDLALFISGDVGMWTYVKINLHLAGCDTCRARIEAYRQSRLRLKQAAAEMPEGADWDRLAAEMTANIRVGLAAGECVAPRRGKLDLRWKPSGGLRGVRSALPASGWPAAGWKVVAAWSAVAAGVAVILSAAWVLNLPSSDGASLAHAMHSLFQGSARSYPGRPASNIPGSNIDDRGPVVEASADGVELRENGVAVSIPQASSRPVAITVSAPGSASARYVDEDTGQMTISSVYVQ